MPGHVQDMVGYAGDMAGTHTGSRLETAKYSTTQTKRFFFFFCCLDYGLNTKGRHSTSMQRCEY